MGWNSKKARGDSSQRTIPAAKSWQFQTGSVFAPIANHLQNGILQVAHHSVTPQVSVPVEVGRDALLTGKMQPDFAIGQGFERVFPAQDVEKRAANGDVLVQGCRRDLRSLWVNRERQAAFRLLHVDVLDEKHTSSKRGMAHAAHSLIGERRLDRCRETDSSCPRSW